MKRIALVMTILGLIYFNALSKILIVDNHVPTPSGAYATIQLAHDAAATGDTLLLTPSEAQYTGITLTKPVCITGNGWAKASSQMPNTKTSGFIFNTGSAGSILTGCEIIGDVTINTGSINIKRNRCNYIGVTQGTNVLIIQNVIIYDRRDFSVNVAGGTVTLISNNIIINNYYSNDYYGSGINILYPSTVIVSNNIVSGRSTALSLNSSSTLTIKNNIVLAGGIGGLTSPFNNIGNSTQFPAIDGNIQNVDINLLFVDKANNDFHLKAGSPAIGAGYGGTDCGVYGGELGFVDKGVPNQIGRAHV